MNVERKVPEIRFKGVSGEWGYVGLLDATQRVIDFRGRTPKKLGLDWSASGYRALSALNVKQGYIDFSIDPHFGDQELYDKWMNGSELHQEQVLFTTEAPMGNVAQVPNSDKYILSQRTIAFVVKSEIIKEDFLAVLLRSPKVFQELSALSSGGTAKGVSQKVLAKLNVSLPKDLNEQTQIGNYFQKLDSLINQHQQQHGQLSNLKKAMLEKMFPKPGETIPEIRFKGFSGEWEKIKLKQIAEIRRGLTYRPDDISTNGVIVLRSSNINVDKFELRKDDVQVSLSAVNISLIKNGDILITSANGSSNLVGKHAIVNGLAVDAVHGGFMLIAETKIPEFLNASMGTYWYKQFLSINVSGGNGAIGNIKGSALEEENLYVPKTEEQTAIGNYFQKLDALIKQHQQQISKLNNIKQAFLSKMFV